MKRRLTIFYNKLIDSFLQQFTLPYRRRWLRRLGILFFITILLNVALVFISNWLVDYYAKGLVYNRLDSIPYNRAGLVLGTSKYVESGQENLYFRYRIEAAIDLYLSGKIDYIIVSGDNRTMSYNEPIMMRNELIECGIPKDVIYLDFAGFRTLDSVIRCKKIFGQDSITIISQQFHNERALYIAHSYNITAIAFNAHDLAFASGFKTQLRELLARVKVILDIHLIDTQPRFLGEKVIVQ